MHKHLWSIFHIGQSCSFILNDVEDEFGIKVNTRIKSEQSVKNLNLAE